MTKLSATYAIGRTLSTYLMALINFLAVLTLTF